MTKIEGEYIIYYENGKIATKRNYKNGKIITKCYKNGKK